MGAVQTPNNPFIRDNESYVCELDPLKGYLEQATTLIEKSFGLERDEAKQYVKDILKESEPVIPSVNYIGVAKNGDKEHMTKSLDVYIKDNISKGNVITPSFTVYANSEKVKSPHNGYVKHNLDARTSEKNLYKEALANKNEDKARYHNVLQKVKKIFNNSLSGAYASKSTILYNPTAHYTLTSMTRAVASIGNAITEMIVAGNRHYTSTETVLSHLLATVSGVNLELIKESISKYSLHIPTVDEIMDMIHYSSDVYYKHPDGDVIIRHYLSGLNQEERAAVMYVNDLYQLRKYNPKLVRGMLKGLGTPYDNYLCEDSSVLEASPDWLVTLVHMVNSDIIKGTKVNYKKIEGTKTHHRLTGTTERVVLTMNYLATMFKAFYSTSVMPIDIVDIKNLNRRSIVISDTDSTCGSYNDYVSWFYGKQEYGEKAAGITGAILTIVTQSMDHYLKQLSANMNIPADKMNMLQMKNEYYWEVVMAPLISKHYYAGIDIKEGYVFDKPDLEIKGVHFIASTIPEKYNKRAKEMFREIIDTIKAGGKIDLPAYLSEVADIEKEILERLEEGDVSLLKTQKIKTEDSYAKDWKGSNFYYYKFWNEVFAPKYGEIPPPPISTSKINTTLLSKGKILKYIESIEDKALKDRLEKFYAKHQKGSWGAFQLPVEIGSLKGIPKELHSVMDNTKIATNICSIFYLILETLGYHKKPGMSLTELGM